MASCIVDTSIWIDFFRGTLPHAVHAMLTHHIEWRLAAITNVIRNEILVGAKDKQAFLTLRRLLAVLPLLYIAPDRGDAFDEFAWMLMRSGHRGKYTDVAIAFLCHEHQLPLLTSDRYFYHLAKKGVVKLVDLR